MWAGLCGAGLPIALEEETMRKTVILCLILCFIGMIHIPALGGDFDGSKELVCACMRVIECGPNGNCTEGSAEKIGIPGFLVIHFQQKEISAPQWGENQTPSRIKNLERIDGKLILQGAEDGLRDVKDGTGWSIAISEETGKMVLTESGDQVAFVVFGACIPR
jgi:hypothetical protein